MSADLSTQCILIIDQGLFLSFALRMAAKGGFGRVLYYNDDRRRGRPSFQESYVGTGYPGIEVVRPGGKVASVWDALDLADVVAFPDCMDWQWMVALRAMGVPVWGAGAGAQLELYRHFAKEIMKAVKLPVGPYAAIRGVTNLRLYLKQNQDKILKVSYVRGLMESRKHEKYWLSKTFLDGLEYRLGPLADEQEFLVEEKIESRIEVGSDQVYVGEFPDRALNGVEIKDCGYVGMVQAYDDLPEEVRMVNDALAPVLKHMGYAAMFSTEIRIAKDGTPYLIDITGRTGSPSGEAQMAVWKNLPEVVRAGANGLLVQPQHGAVWVAQAMIFNTGDETDWCPVEVPTDLQDDVRLYFSLRRGDEHWIIPQANPFDEIGTVVKTGNTAKEAIDACKKAAERIGGPVEVKTDSLDEALKQFEEMKAMGMSVKPIAS